MAKQKTTKSVRYFNEEGPFLSSPKMGVFFRDLGDARKIFPKKANGPSVNTENGKTTISGIFATSSCDAILIRYAFMKQLEYIFLCYLFGLDDGKNNISLVLPEMDFVHSPLELMRDKITWDEILVLLTSRFKFCITTPPNVFDKIKKFITEANHKEKDESGNFKDDLAALNWLIAKAFTQKVVWKIDPKLQSNLPKLQSDS